MIENMLYNLLKQRLNNTEFQNISLEAIIRWIYYFMPQMNGTQSASIQKIIKLSVNLLQIPSFRINSQCIHSMANVSNSHQFGYFILHQMVNKYQQSNTNQRTLKPSTLKDIKCILSLTTNGCNANEDNLFIVLQLIQVFYTTIFQERGYKDNKIQIIRIKATKQQQCTSDIDKIINICYSIAVLHDPSSRIGSKLLDIADNGCFNALYHKLPKNYKQSRHKNVSSFEYKQKKTQIQMYQNQLSSVLETPLIRSRNLFHPMRAFGHSSNDLNDSFNDISLDINRNKKQRTNQRANSVPACFHHLTANKGKIKVRQPNDDDVKEDVNNQNDNNSYSDKENAAKNSKMSGNKRKRNVELTTKEDDDDGGGVDGPSAPKKAKYTKK